MTTTMDVIDAKVPELEEQLEVLSLEKAMTYSLADAIREGSTVTNQCTGAWANAKGEVCALSSALIAVKARHLV